MARIQITHAPTAISRSRRIACITCIALLPLDRIIYSICCARPAESITGLRALGYKPEQSPWEFGDVQVIDVDEAGQLSAGSDPRGRGVPRVEAINRSAPPAQQAPAPALP